MAKKTLEERIEDIENWQDKIDGYGKFVLGVFGALTVVGMAFDWIIEKLIKVYQ